MNFEINFKKYLWKGSGPGHGNRGQSSDGDLESAGSSHDHISWLATWFSLHAFAPLHGHRGRLLRGVAVRTSVDSRGHSLGVACNHHARLQNVQALVVCGVNLRLVAHCHRLGGGARAVRSRVDFLLDSNHALGWGHWDEGAEEE